MNKYTKLAIIVFLTILCGSLIWYTLKENTNPKSANSDSKYYESANNSARVSEWTKAIRLDGSIDSTHYNAFIETVDTSYAGWKKVFSNKGRFSIEFPKKRIGMMKENVVNNNKYKMVYVCQLQSFLPVNSNLGYWADYTFYMEKKKTEDIPLLFDEHREHLLQFYDARLITERAIDSAGYKARELIFVSDEYRLVYTFRLYFHNYILYRVGVTTEASKSGNRFINRFFKSFEMWD